MLLIVNSYVNMYTVLSLLVLYVHLSKIWIGNEFNHWGIGWRIKNMMIKKPNEI